MARYYWLEDLKNTNSFYESLHDFDNNTSEIEANEGNEEGFVDSNALDQQSFYDLNSLNQQSLIDDLNEKLEEQNKELENKDKMIHYLQKILEERSWDVLHRDSEIRKLNDKISYLYKDINNMNIEYAHDKDTNYEIIKKINFELQEKENKINSLCNDFKILSDRCIKQKEEILEEAKNVMKKKLKKVHWEGFKQRVEDRLEILEIFKEIFNNSSKTLNSEIQNIISEFSTPTNKNDYLIKKLMNLQMLISSINEKFS